MQRIRITASENGDPSTGPNRLTILRRDLYMHSPVEIDPDNPAHQTHRDERNRAYFEFSTDFVNEVTRVLRDFGHEGHVVAESVAGPAGEPCHKCGYVAHAPKPSVCPNCKFRDIGPCPHCHQEISREAYKPVSGDLFRCPTCEAIVRLSFNDPLLRSDGSYSQPVVLVEEAAQQPI